MVGFFELEGPKPEDPLLKKGQIAFDLRLFFDKSVRRSSGQTPVKACNWMLCRLIPAGKAQPSFLVAHELPLDKASDAYKHFRRGEEDSTKVVLKPAA